MKKEDLKNLTISKVQKLFESGDTTTEELTTLYLDNIKEHNQRLNAYVRTFDNALASAIAIDEKRKKGEKLGSLAGIPFAVKDAILVNNEIASAGSKILENYKATYDATAIARLRTEGAIFLGSTNMDEFAMGSSNQTSFFGPAKNPIDESRVPGGSSGGSAVAVSGDLSLVALGSDTAGSIRQPASFCGVVGLKTTYGAVSRSGLIAMTSSLDQIGPMTKTVAESEIIFDIISGKDELDSTSEKFQSINSENLSKANITIGVPVDFPKEGVDDDVLANFCDSVEKLKNFGYKIVEIKMPNLKYSLPCYYVVMPAEVSTNLSRFDGVKYGLHKEGKGLWGDYEESRGEGFGREVRRRIILGTYVLSAGYYDAFYNQALKVRSIIKNDFDEAFKKVDAILLPTTPEPAFKIGAKMDDPVKMYLQDIYTVPANIAGVPCISVPSGSVLRDGVPLPLGLQIMAPKFREDIVFRVGKDFEKS